MYSYPYSKLRGPNVQGTIDALKLCATGRPKVFVFVSSTAVLDNDHYVQLSDRLCSAGKAGIAESDDLEGSSTGLGIGYGQVKWVSEYLTREAGARGLRGAIVRPGYISGDSQTGASFPSLASDLTIILTMSQTTNTDDFLIRMLKGCIQLHARPDINNTINMCPVSYVARLVVASALYPSHSLTTVQATSHPRLTFNEYLGMLQGCGYDVPKVDYMTWRSKLERYVANSNPQDRESQHALLPLYHFVTADLPTNTKAPELDDANALAALKLDAESRGIGGNGLEGSSVNLKTMRRYLGYLIAVGFLQAPEGKGDVEDVILGEGQREALGMVGGRGGMV